jgi:hypothetical protein
MATLCQHKGPMTKIINYSQKFYIKINTSVFGSTSLGIPLYLISLDGSNEKNIL